jgi:drug/metabolite transporter (DMT)-like permease
MLLAALFFSLMAATVKSVPNLPVTEKIFFRNFIGLIFISFTIFRQRISLKPNKPKLMFFRAFLGMLGVTCYYLAIGHLNLSDAVIVNKMSPFFVIVFSVIFLKETVMPRQIVALFMAVAGVVVVLRPSFDYSALWGAIAVMSAIFAGSAYTIVRRLTMYDSPVLIVFYFCLLSSVVLVPAMFIEGAVIPTLFEMLALVGIGTFALTGQMLMTHAYQYAPASELSIYNYAEILYALLFGILFWGEIPDGYSLIGCVLIVFAGVINFSAALRRARG